MYIHTHTGAGRCRPGIPEAAEGSKRRHRHEGTGGRGRLVAVHGLYIYIYIWYSIV